MTRTKALLIVAPLALTLVALLLLPLFVDKDKLLELASAAIREQTGATLTVEGPVELALIPRIGLSLADVSLAMPGEEQAGLQVRSLQLGLQLLPLLSGRVEVHTLSLDGLASRIAATEKEAKIDSSSMSDAQLDEFYLQRRQSQAEAGAAAGAEVALALPLALNVQMLRLTDARLELLAADGAAPTVIEVQRLEAQDLNLDARPIKLQGKLRLPAEQAITLALQGTVRLDQQRQQLVLDGLEIELIGIAADLLKLQASGEADLNRRSADLQLLLEAAGTRGEGSLRYTAFESPQIDATLHFNQFDPALLALAGPDAAGGAAQQPAASADDPLPLAALRAIDTRADLTVDSALLGGHLIQNLHLALRAVDGVIRIDSLTGMVHGGQLQLQGTFDGKHNSATVATSGALSGLDIGSALAATEVGPIATGQANLEWQLSSAGRSRGELMAGLNGPIRLATAELVLRDIGIEGMLCKAVALTNQENLTATFPTDTRFEALTADIQLTDGSALLRPLRAELPGLSLTGNGRYELLNQDFDTTFKARLSPELETLDRACRVSKRLTAIDWPVHCRGNANGDAGKWCNVDSAKIIEDLTRNEGERKLKKEAGKLLDKLFKR